jgi:hypothetical protein
VVDEEAPPHLRGDGEEVRAVLPTDVLPVNQTQVSLTMPATPSGPLRIDISTI